MSNVRMESKHLNSVETSSSDRRKGWFAAGGIIGAILASACCVVPLVLVTLGISGAWLGNLTALEPYKPYVATVPLGLIGLGFCHVSFSQNPAFIAGSYFARPHSSIIPKSTLWLPTDLCPL